MKTYLLAISFALSLNGLGQTKEELYNRATDFYGANRDSAIFYWNEYIKLDSTNSEAFEWRARNFEWFHPEKAILDYEKAIALDSDNLNAYTGLGNALEEVGKYEEALEIFHYVLDHDGHYGILLNMANLYEKTKDYDALKECVAKMITTEDGMIAKYGYMKLGHMYFNQKKYSKALDNYDKASKVGMPDGNEFYRLALTYIELGKKQEACENLKKFQKSDDFEFGQYEGIDELIQENCK